MVHFLAYWQDEPTSALDGRTDCPEVS